MKENGQPAGHDPQPADPPVEAEAEAEASGAEAEPSPEQIRIAELETELGAIKDQLLRALADAQNARRRHIQEVATIRQTAAEALAAKLLPVLDGLEKAILAAESGASLSSLLEGVRLTDKMLREALAEFNVRPILAVGETFDPTLHEAVAVVESGETEGTIVEEVERGYTIGQKVLRPTKAKVSKGTAK